MAELEASTNLGARRARPLSPHLQIYRPMLTMMMSIVHRITGAALYFGMAILAWWLLAAASGPNAYASFEAVAGSLIGQIVLFGFTWELIHHALGGIRHLIWDLIYGFEPAEREMLAVATIVGSIALTIAFIVIAVALVGRSHAAVGQILGSPLVAVIMLLFILNTLYHMWIGMQEIVLDYVHDDKLKILALLGNTCFVFAVGFASAFAILKLSFGV